MITTILLTILAFYLTIYVIYGVAVLLMGIVKFTPKILLVLIMFLIFPFIKTKDEEHPVAWKIVKILLIFFWLLMIFIIVMETTH